MTPPNACRPVVTRLEDRVVPAINVLFDFRFDDFGFIADHPDRIATIRAAAAEIGARFTDTLNAIPFPTNPGSNSWNAQFQDPSGLTDEQITNLIVPANTIVVFVGARDLLGEPTRASSGREATGTPVWFDTVFGRGQANSYGTGATDFSPWGGSITFDLINNWHFGIEPPGGSTEIDLYTATQKALLHLFGFGASDAWTRIASGDQFFGPQAVAVNGGANVPLDDGPDGEPNYVWVEDTLSKGQRTLMDRDIEDGERIPPTALDLAAMADIGWKFQSTSPPPPAAPPPIAAPAPIAPGTALVAVGSGAGGPTQFTVNAAASFTQLAAFNPYPGFAGGAGFTGGVRVATADVDLDGVEDIIVGPGPGTAAEIKVYGGANFPTSPDTSLIASGYAFETSFLGGVFISVGDINRDGVPDLVVTPDEGGGPRVRVISGKDRTVIADFLGIDDTAFRGGARTAVGDLNNDGNVDLVVAAGFGGGPRVAVYDGKSLRPGSVPTKLLNDFFLFEQELRNGAYVAVGDINGDGFGDLIGGGGPGGGPRVYALSGMGLTQQNGAQTVVANFFAGDTNNRGGVPVAAKNIDGDQRADIVAGAGTGAQSVVTTYLGSAITPSGTPAPYHRFLVFDSSFLGGAYVG